MADSERFFSSKLNQALCSQVDQNVVFSPLSVFLAVAMVLVGTRGNTLEESISCLGFDKLNSIQKEKDELKRVELISESIKGLTESLKNAQKDKILSVVNKIYVDGEFKLHEQYESILKSSFDSKAELCDFKKKHDKERSKINSFVQEFTNNKIKNLLSKGAVHTDTKSVLVNAIYFKGEWMKKFNEKTTEKSKMFKSFGNKKESKCDLMTKRNVKELHGINPEGGFSHVKLPYKGNKYSMIFMLPLNEGKEAFEQMEKYLCAKGLENYYSELPLHRNDLSILQIPKFKTEFSSSLIPKLKQVGLNKMFAPDSDLSGVSKEKIEIGSVVHKAFIEVNEEGTEAAAATAITFQVTSVSFLPKVKHSFICDRPFMYMIVDDTNQTILFSGKIMSF